MKASAVAYGASLIVFLALDAAWLGLVAKDFYQSQIGSLMLDPPNLVAAAVFYPMFVVGIVLFVIHPALEAQSLGRAILFGGLYGLFAYGTYDITNLATIKGWTLAMVLVDMGWGLVVTACAAAAGYAAAHALGR
jgi:uncharacterized membrane protein